MDACIAGDMAVILFLRKLGVPVHMTVQSNVCNVEAVRFYAQFADVMVLARELTLKNIEHIIRTIRKENITGPSGKLVRIEVFAHGALCVAVSGKCYMSLSLCGASANRGKCLQPCRRRYLVKDQETGDELAIENEYVMSPKDLCTIPFLDQLVKAGISVFKLEGRGRSADYVAKVCRVYRQALDSCLDGSFSSEKTGKWVQELTEVFNRGFWMGGYYLGKPLDAWSGSGGSQAVLQKEYIGKITNYFSKIGVAECKIETSQKIAVGDRVVVIGSATGAVEFVVNELRQDGENVPEAGKGALISFPLDRKVRYNDLFYLLKEREIYE